jgi:hypothetical protein
MVTSVVATSGSLAAAGSEDTSRGCAPAGTRRQGRVEPPNFRFGVEPADLRRTLPNSAR